MAHHEMMEKLEHSELQKVTLHNHSVHWYKKGKEIMVNSTLFDVHSYSVTNDSTIFEGLFDIKETELKNHIIKLLEQKDQNKSTRNIALAKLMLQLWFNNIDNIEIKWGTSLSINRKAIIASDKTLSAYFSIPVPPPRA